MPKLMQLPMLMLMLCHAWLCHFTSSHTHTPLDALTYTSASTYVCVYIYIYTSIHLSIYLSLSLYIYIYIHTYAVYILICACIDSPSHDLLFQRTTVHTRIHLSSTATRPSATACPCPPSPARTLHFPAHPDALVPVHHLLQLGARGSDSKGGRHSMIFVNPQWQSLFVKCPSVQWQPDRLTIHTKKWLPRAGFLGAPPISLTQRDARVLGSSRARTITTMYIYIDIHM